MVQVVEVEQGIRRGAIEGKRIADLEFNRYVRLREVAEDARPPWGTGWWREDADGLRLWKENRDTSD